MLRGDVSHQKDGNQFIKNVISTFCLERPSPTSVRPLSYFEYEIVGKSNRTEQSVDTL